MKEITLKEFLDQWGEALAERVMKVTQPVHNPLDQEPDEETDRKLQKINQFRNHSRLGSILPAQAEIIKAVAKGFFIKNYKSLILAGEMGTGKTLMAASVVKLSHSPIRTLVVCPPHLTKKWCQEIRQSIPGVYVENTSGKDAVAKLITLMESGKKKPERFEFYICSRERVKNSYGWKPAVFNRCIDSGNRNWSYLYCPDCGNRLLDQEDEEKILPITMTALRKKKQFCHAIIGYKIPVYGASSQIVNYKRVSASYKPEESQEALPVQCGCALWSAIPKPRRFAPAELIKKKLKDYFQMLIADEVHEMKAANSIQGNAFGTLTSCCEKTLCLTGTLSGGYSLDIFYILFRMSPEQLKADGFEYRKEQEWMSRYGVLEMIEYINEEDARTGRGKKSAKIIKQKPGISPLVVAKHILHRAAFIKIADIWQSLPSYQEYPITIEMNEDQKKSYEKLEEDLKTAIQQSGKKAPMQLLSKMIQALLSYPDSCVVAAEQISIPDEDGCYRPIASAPRLHPDITLPKENKLIQIVSEELRNSRRVIVFATFTDSRDIQPRIQSKLEEAGVKTTILRSSVKPENRIEWFSKKVADGIDCVITNPELVKTGLDLLDFPTFVFFQTGYNIFTLRQASRRSWRIGQKHPVKVIFLTYDDTAQSHALILIANKLETALLLEGELPEDGLTSIATVSNTILEDLAKSLQTGIRGSAEAAWTQLRKRELLNNSTVGPHISLPEISSQASQLLQREETLKVQITQIDELKTKRSTIIETTTEKLSEISAKDPTASIQLLLF